MTLFVDTLNAPDVQRACGLAIVGAAAAYYFHYNRSAIRRTPSVGGPDYPILSYWGTLQFLLRGRELLNEGYSKYKGRAFKIAALDRWLVVLTSKNAYDELRRLPDDVMSFQDASNEMLDIEYTLGPEIATSSWHNDPVRVNLPKNMDTIFPDVHDEVSSTLQDLIKLDGDEWLPIVASPLIQEVVCRASNRIFVGLPLCRDPGWIKLNIDFTMDVLKGIFISKLFPSFLRPLTGRVFNTVKTRVAEGLAFIAPTIKERRQKLEAAAKGEPYTNKPNDMLMWLLEHEKGVDASLNDLATRMLTLNFAAIHSTSTTTLHALYVLATNPAHILPLRAEVDAVIAQYGWTREAMGHLTRLDAYVKETARYISFSGLVMMRMARKSHTFSDGTTVPAGTIVGLPAQAMHHDELMFPNASEFDPLRYVKRDEDDLAGGQLFTTTGRDFLNFGGGKHVCPGRFFASNEIKNILCHLIIDYDFKTEIAGVRPKDSLMATEAVPSRTARILFRKRQN